ncbi:MAG: hypothetical protein LBD84_01060 [Campylobacteraceae bacterium]|nr:hypothetical protein [Campylobacteraceae bacterium]
MKKISSVIFVLFFVFNQNAYSISKKELACEAILCLSSPTSISGCQVALAYYYGISAWTLGAVIAARVAFLSLCKEYKGDIRNIVVTHMDPPATGGSNGGGFHNTDTSASTTYDGTSKAKTASNLNGASNNNKTPDYGYGSYGGYGESGFSSGGSGGGSYGNSDSSDENDDNDENVNVNNRTKNSNDELIDSNGDGIFDTTVGELQSKCSAEELNKLQDYTKTKIRTIAKLPEYCDFLLDRETVILPTYTCNQEFYYVQDWTNGYKSEEADIKKYKAWKSNKGNGRTNISEDGTTITYTIYKPIKKACWIEPENAYDPQYDYGIANINENVKKQVEEADAKATNIEKVFDISVSN